MMIKRNMGKGGKGGKGGIGKKVNLNFEKN
jgi:hypothetical protein